MTDDDRRWETEAGVPRAGQEFPGSRLRSLHVPGSSLPPDHRPKSAAATSSQLPAVGGYALPARALPVASEDFRQIQADLNRFCWGGLLWGPWWALYHRVWLGLLGFVPGVGFAIALLLGYRGRRWAWENGTYANLSQFQRAQRWWGLSFLIAMPVVLPCLYGAGRVLGDAAQRYLAGHRVTEAKVALSQLGEGMVRCAGAQGKLPRSSGWVPEELSEVSGRSYSTPPVEWRHHAAFNCAGFTPESAQVFQFRWIADGPTIGKATARADLDGDGQVDHQLSLVVSCTKHGCRAALPVAEPVVGLQAAPGPDAPAVKSDPR